MKKEALEMAKQAYITESQCIQEMANYFDEEAYGKAVELLKNAPRIGSSGCGHSGIMKSDRPYEMVEEMLYNLRKAWDELH